MKRVAALDSVRGLAALVVVMHHLFISLPPVDFNGWGRYVRLTPLRILIAGHGAVLVFFILSGFVLSLAFDQTSSLSRFYIKRFCRIYLPFAASILVAVNLRLAFGSIPDPALSEWFNTSWQSVISLTLIVRHLLGTGLAKDIDLDNPMWSLVIEARIAIIFPALIYFAKRWRTMTLVVGLGLFVAMNIILPMVGETEDLYVSSVSIFGSLLITIRYIPFFLIGIVLADTLPLWQPPLERTSRLVRTLLLIACVALLSAPTDLAQVSDLVLGLGSAILVAIAVAFGPDSRLLAWSPIGWLGRVSYSLYLIHLPLWLVIGRMVSPGLSIPAVLVIYIPALFLLTQLFHLIVERPSIKLAHVITATSQLTTQRHRP